jgi:Helix-turn-helix domain
MEHELPEAEGGFGRWLRHERERRRISIVSIAESTKILGALFEGLENEDLSRWPPGLYRRAFVRAYANAIGLDPDDVVSEFLIRFPEPGAQPTADRRARAAELPVLRLTLVDSRERFDLGLLVRKVQQRSAAVLIDAAAITVLTVCLWIASDLLWESLAIVATGYSLMGTLMFGATLGMCVMAPGNRRNVPAGFWHTARKFGTRLVNHSGRGWFERSGTAESPISSFSAHLR